MIKTSTNEIVGYKTTQYLCLIYGCSMYRKRMMETSSYLLIVD